MAYLASSVPIRTKRGFSGVALTEKERTLVQSVHDLVEATGKGGTSISTTRVMSSLASCTRRQVSGQGWYAEDVNLTLNGHELSRTEASPPAYGIQLTGERSSLWEQWIPQNGGSLFATLRGPKNMRTHDIIHRTFKFVPLDTDVPEAPSGKFI
ncbi:hypothetical protein NMY22_g17038 [Coprinellus aureogranulatus]|nr:hypothetical protein NMY22_g17038 [Coprinellus aureogranulatus]